MDYRYMRPLFESNDTDNAREFIIENMINSDVIGIMGETNDGDHEILGLKDIPREHIAPVLTHIVDAMYGVNIPLMANYLVVQQSINDIYKESILKYLDYVGVRAKFVDIIPSQFLTVSSIMKSKQNDFEAFDRLNPNINWDPNADYLKRNIDISNPLSSYNHSYLMIENFSNKEFLKSVTNRVEYDNKFRDIDLDNNPLKNVCIQVLPSSDFNAIYDIVTNIHKYF